MNKYVNTASAVLCGGAMLALGIFSNTATPVVQFGTIRGTYTFLLTVTDSLGTSSSDTVTLNYAGF